MIDIADFDFSLKLTWVRKTIQSDHEWSHFALENKIDKLVWTGENYHNQTYLETSNPFWRSVIYSYKKWYIALKEITTIEIGEEPLWGNPKIQIPFNKALFTSNIIHVHDLYTQQGQKLSKEQLEFKTGKNIMLTTYFELWKALPRNWKIELQNKVKMIGVRRPFPIEWLTKDKKGTSNIRKVFRENKKPNIRAMAKWEEELDMDDNEEWTFLFYLPIKSKLNARCTYFQIQILHRTIITNRKLKQFNIRDNEMWDICGEIETISHMLIDCEPVLELWIEFGLWLEGLFPNHLYLDKISILLGNSKNEMIVNNLITITKHEIYKNIWMNHKLNLFKLKTIFKIQMELEIYLETIKKNLPKVLGKWATVYYR